MNRLKKFQTSFFDFYQRHETLVTLFIFLLGFSFDLITVGEIDDFQNILQQSLYLVLISGLLFFEIIQDQLSLRVLSKLKFIKNYHNLIIHFLFGSLLSIHTIFYFNSASIFSSFIFLALIAGLTLANEFEFFKQFGIVFRIILYNICLLSFFLILSPTLLGSLGFLSFNLGLFCSVALNIFFYKVLKKFNFNKKINSQFIATFLLTHFLFLIFYFFSLIPPVPVALKKIGVYYEFEKSEGKYIGKYLNNSLYFWHKGSQLFQARNNDLIVILLSVYSPASFKDNITLHWSCKDEENNLATQDFIKLEISGGRKEGYRGYAMKQNFPIGTCDIRVMTSDDRELGSIWVKVSRDLSNQQREFLTESY